MKTFKFMAMTLILATGLSACDGEMQSSGTDLDHGHSDEAQPEKGPNNGRLLTEDGFMLELAIFETGVPPEFRVWTTMDGVAVDPGKVNLTVRLTRLGGAEDLHRFNPQDDYLRGDAVVYEPHSFVVSVEASHAGRNYQWSYDNLEGRTRIAPDVAEAFGLETEWVGPAEIRENVRAYGRVVPDPSRLGTVSARFDGVIRSVTASVGDTVKADQILATVESNESLNDYSVRSPIEGTIIERSANPGEQTAGRRLFTILDSQSVWVELAVFLGDLPRVRAGAEVLMRSAVGDAEQVGTISQINNVAEADQSVQVRVVLDNTDGSWPPGSHVSADIRVGKYSVPLAVKRVGLQSFRDFTVVYAQVGDEYEVRMLDLGRQDAQWVEVLGGIELGTRYVTDGSFLIKADIEKSGASHDH